MAHLTENHVLGTLMGLAIGDALGMPLIGMSEADARAALAGGARFLPQSDAAGGAAAGEVTDETETVLAISEGLTTNGGRVDVDLIGPRLVYLAGGDSRKWIPEETLRGLDAVADTFAFRVPLDEDARCTLDLAIRGVPIGVVHAAGSLDQRALADDAEAVIRISSGSTSAITAATAVALMVRFALRREAEPGAWLSRVDTVLASEGLSERRGIEGTAEFEIGRAVACVAAAGRFEEAVSAAAQCGGPADGRAALAGALAGAWFGAAGIPQGLIDDLGCRIYVSLAAPWLLKAAQRRAGMIIDLRPKLDQPRPEFPPRQ